MMQKKYEIGNTNNIMISETTDSVEDNQGSQPFLATRIRDSENVPNNHLHIQSEESR